ncbi:MAG: diguanylate cyclase [Desulfobacterota bacterium]|nr:diguanylate cyclase [Thermodesulfobacteriota bacterium]MDW8002072.1 diguanylate cyclase [Deltaproteobacteria bacterium]
MNSLRLEDGIISSGLDCLPLPILIVEESGKIRYANREAAKFFSFAEEEFGKSIEENEKLRSLGLSQVINAAITKDELYIDSLHSSSPPKRVIKLMAVPLRKEKPSLFLLVFLDPAHGYIRWESLSPFLVYDTLPLGIVVTERDGRILMINREFTKITGYAQEEIPHVKILIRKVIPDSERRRNFFDLLKSTIKKGEDKAIVFPLVCKDGSVKEVEIKVEVLDERRVITSRDVTPFKAMERELVESERRYRSLFENSRDAIYITSSDGRFLDVNPAFCDLFGEKKEEILKKSAKDAYVTDDEKLRLKSAIGRHGFVKDFEIRLRKANGEVLHCLVTVTAIRDETGKIAQYQGIVRDITEKKRTEEKMRYMAFHDLLTGLPNRSLFVDRLEIAIAYAKRMKTMVAVMMLDLDRFKEINDFYGHTVGDMVLKEVAERLKSVIRRTDTIARMGGDEFIGIFTNIKNLEDVATIGNKVHGQFKSPIVVRDQKFLISVSIGFALYPIHGTDIETLLRKADLAMYQVKQASRDGFKIYEEGTLASLDGEAELD